VDRRAAAWESGGKPPHSKGGWVVERFAGAGAAEVAAMVWTPRRGAAWESGGKPPHSKVRVMEREIRFVVSGVIDTVNDHLTGFIRFHS
jgi:hypothetical protein